MWPRDSYLIAPASLLPPLLFEAAADDPNAFTLTGNVVDRWGPFTALAGSVTLEDDSVVSGGKVVRTDIGATLATAAGVADGLHQQATTFILVARQRSYYAAASQVIADSSGGGASAGWQLRAIDSDGSGAYRIYRPRVSDGSSWLIDHASNAPANTYEALKTCILIVTTTPEQLDVEVDHALSFSDTFAVTLPSSPGGPLVIGGVQWDYVYVCAYAEPLSPTQRFFRVAELAARFDIDVVTYVASDNFARNLGFPSMALMNDGRLIATYRNGVEHSGTDGVGHAIFSNDAGDTWGGDITLIANDGSGEDVRESCVAVLANHDVIATWFTTLASPAGLDANYWKLSSDNGVTWSAKTRVTFGHTEFEATSGPIIQKGSRILWPTYCKDTTTAFSSCYTWYSDDNLATWTETVVADGVADSRNYSEVNFLNILYATPGLSVGDVYALIRDDAGQMYESHSATGIGAWSSPVNTGMAAHSAARIIQLADGTILYLGRPNAQLVATLYRRNGPSDWTEVPMAPALDAYVGTMTYGAMLELTPGEISVVYSTQEGDNPNDHAITTFRRWPEWQLFGQMPLLLNPTNPTITSGQTQAFTARGAGNFVWSVVADATSSSINASTGVLTAGANDGSGTVRCTDLNGYFVDTPFTVTGGTVTVPPTSIDAANLTAWWDPTQGLGTTGSQVDTWTSADGSAKILSRTGSPQVGAGLNAHASIEFNGTADYFTDLTHTLADFIAAGVGWTATWVSKDTGSPADTGIYFFNAPAFADGAVGNFAFGTTATSAFAGQDGNSADYDQIAQTGGAVNYYVATYTVSTGLIQISKNGGPFSAGTAVTAIANFTGNIFVGKCSFNSNFFKGSMGDIAIWKSTLSGTDVGKIQAYYAAKYA